MTLSAARIREINSQILCRNCGRTRYIGELCPCQEAHPTRADLEQHQREETATQKEREIADGPQCVVCGRWPADFGKVCWRCLDVSRAGA